MSNLPALRIRELLNTGAVGNGNKLYFYAPGTETTRTVYSERTLTTPHANPVVADSTGLFAEIFMSLDTAYRVILKDASNNTIWDVDNVYADTLDGTTLRTQVYETSNNPNRYGAVGDGLANEVTYVQAAIDAAVASSRKGVVDLMGRTYLCNSALTLPSGITIRNGTLDFTNCTADDYMLAAGTVGSTVALTANADYGDSDLTVASVTGIASGDLLYVTHTGGAEAGELVRVKGTSGSTQIDLIESLNAAYTTANSATHREIAPLRDIRLDNLVLIASSGASGAGRVIRIDACENVAIDNVRIQGWKGTGIEVRRSIDVQITNCKIHPSSATLGAKGIYVLDASRDVDIERCSVGACTDAIRMGGQTASSTGGMTRWVSVSNCKINGADIGVYVDKFAQFVTVQGCKVQGFASTSVGIFNIGYAVTIDNCMIRHSSAYGIYVNASDANSLLTTQPTDEMRSCTISNCNIKGATTAAILCNSNTFEQLAIINNAIHTATTAISLALGEYEYVNISGNRIEATGSGLVTLAVTGGTMLVSGNILTKTRLNIDQATDVIIDDNVFDDWQAGQAAITLGTVGAAHVRGNAIHGATDTIGIAANDCTQLDISNNTMRGVEGASSKYIDIDDCRQLTISANALGLSAAATKARRAIEVTATDVDTYCLAITGNSIEGIDTDSAIYVEGTGVAAKVYGVSIDGNTVNVAGRCVQLNGYIEGGVVANNTLITGNAITSVVYLNGAATDSVNNIAITGNAIREGVNGIELTNAALVSMSANSFYSQSTGPITGNAYDAGQIYMASVAISNTLIVGNSAGDLGHASGVTLVAAVAGKVIVPVAVAITFTYSTAAYTAGGDVSAKYLGGDVASTVVTAGNSFGAGATNISILYPATGGVALVNTALILVAAAAFTDPGTAAGTAVVKTYYRLIDA